SPFNREGRNVEAIGAGITDHVPFGRFECRRMPDPAPVVCPQLYRTATLQREVFERHVEGKRIGNEGAGLVKANRKGFERRRESSTGRDRPVVTREQPVRLSAL